MADYAGPITGAPTIEDPAKVDPYQLYVTEVTYAESELKKFHERGRRVVRKYVDERDAMDSAQKWFNLFHANTNILKSALYAQMPKPEVKRKYLDYNDDVARVAAIMLQRAIQPDGDDPRDLFDSMMRSTVLDRLVSGLGTCWLRLETETVDEELVLEQVPYMAPNAENQGFLSGPSPDAPQTPPDPPVPEAPPPAGAAQGMPPQSPPPAAEVAAPQAPQVFKRITDQKVCVDYVYWEDLLWSPCRVWEERRWVARIVYMDRDQLVKRFGEEIGRKIPLNHKPSGVSLNTWPAGITPINVAIQRAKIYEFWNRLTRTVCWFCRDYQGLLDERDDFLNLIGFEPCPKPMLANISTSNTVPRPDYYIVQDQYIELDTVNERISRLVQACKVVGVYDRASDGVQRMLQEGFDNQLIPVDNWAQFSEKGGVKGQVDWLPLEQVINTLQRLYEAREGIKAQIYELTGIADIVRGASKASETLGAQEIKAKFASIRIKDIQDEVARFAAEVLRIKAELMVKHYDPEILKRKSNIMRTDDAMLADQAVQMLQSEEGFEWRIVVTADQLAQADYAMEKQDRIELLTSVSEYMVGVGPIIDAQPETAPLFVGMLKWAVSGFKGARDIEGMLDRHLDEMLKRPAEPEPDPDAEKNKAELEKIQAETQAVQQKGQIQGEIGKQKLQFDAVKSRQDLQASAMKSRQDLQANALKHRQAMIHQQQMDKLRKAKGGTKQ